MIISNEPAENALRIREDTLLLLLSEEVGGQNGVGDGLDRGEGRHEGWHVGVVGSEHELASGDAVAEETFDLVVEHGSGAVVPDSEGGEVLVMMLQSRDGGLQEVVVFWGRLWKRIKGGRKEEIGHTSC